VHSVRLEAPESVDYVDLGHTPMATRGRATMRVLAISTPAAWNLSGFSFRSGFERAEIPGRSPENFESVIPHRYFSAAGVVLCGLKVSDQPVGATGIDQ